MGILDFLGLGSKTKKKKKKIQKGDIILDVSKLEE